MEDPVAVAAASYPERPGYEATVAVTTGELVVGCQKFPQFARCLYDQIGQFSVKLLVLGLENIVLSFLNFSSARNLRRKKIFAGTNFRELVLDHENFCLMKMSHYATTLSKSTNLMTKITVNLNFAMSLLTCVTMATCDKI